MPVIDQSNEAEKADLEFDTVPLHQENNPYPQIVTSSESEEDKSTKVNSVRNFTNPQKASSVWQKQTEGEKLIAAIVTAKAKNEAANLAESSTQTLGKVGQLLHNQETSSNVLLMSYVAYYLSRGRAMISLLKRRLFYQESVDRDRGYPPRFQLFLQQLQHRQDFAELYLERDIYFFGQYLGRNYSISECARCQLAVPMVALSDRPGGERSAP